MNQFLTIYQNKGKKLTARTTKLRLLETEERDERERGTWETAGLRRPLKEEGIDKEWEKTRFEEEDLGEREALVVEERRAVEAAAAKAID